MCENFRGLNLVDETKFMKTSKISPLEINLLYGMYIVLLSSLNMLLFIVRMFVCADDDTGAYFVLWLSGTCVN